METKVKQMDKPVYDDRGISKWIGIPSLFIGAFSFWIAISIFCQYYLDLDFRFQMRGEARYPLLAIIACLALGYWMSNVFFVRTQYYFEPATQELLVRHASLLGRSDKVLSLQQAEYLYVRRGKIRGGVFFDFGIRFLSGKLHLITRARNSEDLPISKFASATSLSVEDWSLSGDVGVSTSNARIEDVPPNA